MLYSVVSNRTELIMGSVDHDTVIGNDSKVAIDILEAVKASDILEALKAEIFSKICEYMETM